MSNRDWKKWLYFASIRAVKTMAQTFVATIGSTTVLGAVDWRMVFSATVLGGILSIATSVAGIPEEKLTIPEITGGE